MKKKNFILLLILVGVIVFLILYLQNENKDILEICAEYAENYDVEKVENKNKITIVAPDFALIGKQIGENEEEITGKTIKRAIKENSKEKEYEFFVEEITDESVREKFLDVVARELMISSISSVDFSIEEWSVEK